MNIKLQIQLSKEAGYCTETKQSWEKEYKYHLGMVENPLPFEQFKIKANLLSSYLKSDPDGKNSSIDKEIDRLCRELGY